MSIYRRGAVYWWHRQVPLGDLPLHPIKPRMSLKTSEKSEARARALALDTELEMVALAYPKRNPGATREHLETVFREALEYKRDQIADQQSLPPYDFDENRLINSAMARTYGLLARTGSLNVNDAEWKRALSDEAMTERERGLFLDLAANYRFQSPSACLPSGGLGAPQLYPVAPRFVQIALKAAGLTDSPENRKTVLSVMASAYQQALLQANDHLASGDVDLSLPHLPKAMIDQLAAFAPKVTAPCTHRCADVAPLKSDELQQHYSAVDRPAPSSPSASIGLIDLRMSEVMKLATETYTRSGDWQKSAQRNAKVIADIFIAENGDLRMSEIEPKHLTAVRRRLEIMPTIWGKSREDRAGGLAAVFARGEALKAAWDAAADSKDRKNLETIGFSATTINRHIRTLKQQLNFVRDLDDGNGESTHVVPRASLRKLTVKDRRPKNGRKPVPTSQEMHALLSSPLHLGCAGPDDRFSKGEIVIHDSGYWMILILAVYGSRSNEFCQLPLAHVFEKAPVPFFRIKESGDRTLKTTSTSRDLPIAPKFVELGFNDYVQALRERGDFWLFPELNMTAEPPRKVFLEDVFRPLVQTVFPHGTLAKVGDKDIDTQSMRKFLSTFLRAKEPKIPLGTRQGYFGHGRTSTLEDIYEDNFTAEELLPCVIKAQRLIAHLQPAPLRLLG